MAKRRRYYSEDDYEIGVTPAQLKKLGKAKQIEYMTSWFHGNFEDPVHNTSYVSAEGGYMWNHGGPYDASEQLYDEFAGLVSEKRIEEAAEEVQSDGIYEWAASDNHPDQQRDREEQEAEDRPDFGEPAPGLAAIIEELERGVEPHLGSSSELALRQEVLTSLDRLGRALPQTSPQAGIGHNQPPPDGEDTQESVAAKVRDDSEVIRSELQKQKPDVLEVARATSRLKTAWGWLTKKVDTGLDSFAKTIGATAGAAVATAVYPPLRTLLQDCIHHLSQWIANVIPPF